MVESLDNIGWSFTLSDRLPIATNIVVKYERGLFGSMDSFYMIEKWSFLKAQEKKQRKILDLWSQLSTSLSFHFFCYNNFFAEQVQC